MFLARYDIPAWRILYFVLTRGKFKLRCLTKVRLIKLLWPLVISVTGTV